VGALLVILAAWMIVRGADFPVALAAVLASGLLISHHAFLRDAVLLVPACLLMMQKPGIRAYMVTGTLILCPLVYLPFLVSNPPIRPAAVILVPLLVLAAVELRIGTSQAADELG
jgi:hypothetical protein